MPESDEPTPPYPTVLTLVRATRGGGVRESFDGIRLGRALRIAQRRARPGPAHERTPHVTAGRYPPPTLRANRRPTPICIASASPSESDSTSRRPPWRCPLPRP